MNPISHLESVFQDALPGPGSAEEAFRWLPPRLRNLRWPAAAALLLFNGLAAAAWLLARGQSHGAAFACLVAAFALGDSAAILLLARSASALRAQARGAAEAREGLEWLRSLAEASPAALLALRVDGRCAMANRACLQLLGYEDESALLGRRPPLDESDGALGRLLEAAALGQGARAGELWAIRADGARLAVACLANPWRAPGGNSGASLFLEDRTQAKAEREAWLRQKVSLEGTLREMSLNVEEMALFGQLAEMLQASDSQQELCGVVAVYAKALFPGASGAIHLLQADQPALELGSEWGGGTGRAEGTFPADRCWGMRRGKPHYQEDGRDAVFCGHVALPHPAYTYCLPLSGQGTMLGLLELRAGEGAKGLSGPRQLVAVALAYQVAMGLSNLRLRESLREEAIRDAVTGLLNRRAMAETLDHEIARAARSGGSVGVIGFDLDHFKEANDTLGHAAGDALLRGVADLTKAGLRGGDVACRQGGDEFFLILPGIHLQDALDLAEDLRLRVDRMIRQRFPSLSGRVSLSAGVALYPGDAGSAGELQKAADQALYRAKAEGRNRVAASGASAPPDGGVAERKEGMDELRDFGKAQGNEELLGRRKDDTQGGEG